MYYGEFAKREAAAKRKLAIAQFIGFSIASSAAIFFAFTLGHYLAN